MNMSRIYTSTRLILFILTITSLLSACTSLKTSPIQTDLKSLQKRYAEAVKDAETVDPDEITKDLTAVTQSNRQIVWKDTPAGKRLLVVTWTSWDGYDQKVGHAMINKQSGGTWVTVVPELKNFCKMHINTVQNIDIRLKQLLGLPPTVKKTNFVEIWVDPKDLFRPSPDPEITDCESELDFPLSDRFVTVSEEYKEWFFDRKTGSYGADGYPWTRLGYTYDWGNPESEIGLSEFVIREGATIEINSVTKTWDYCH